MSLRQNVRNKWRALVQSYGTQNLKSRLWNREFLQGRWDCLDATSGDCVYPYVQKYANGGSILDLGCGSGSTANELPANAYATYKGVDISDVAIAKAGNRTRETGRSGRSSFFQSDVFSYAPDQQFDVILLRDSIYYVPQAKIKEMLLRYAKYLKAGGAFIVRMCDGMNKYKATMELIENNFEIIEKCVSRQPNAVILVFRRGGK